MESKEKLKRSLVQYARSLGFERVGIASAAPLLREGDFLKRWLAEDRAGVMNYMKNDNKRF